MHLPRLGRPLSPGLLPWRRLPTGSRRLQRSAGSRPASAGSAAASDQRVSRSCRAGGNVPGAACDRSVSSRVRLPGFSGRRGRRMQPSRPRTVEAGAQVFATARNRPIPNSCRPQDVVVAGASSDPQLRRVLAVVKARRSAPPPLRGALGLNDGSAHACPDWLLSDDAQL